MGQPSRLYSRPSRTAIPRRSFLRGMGVSLALPLLDSMRPVLAENRALAETIPPRRLFAIQTDQGIMPHLFFPEDQGRDYRLSPYLQLLEPLRNQFTVFSGISHPGVDGGHANEKSYLTGAPHPGGAGFRNSVSVDQIAAESLVGKTRLPYLALGLGNNSGISSMSHTRAGIPIPGESSAAAVYKRLFVQGTRNETAARIADLQSGRSLLDFVSDSAKRLERKIGAADRARLDQYCTSLRELEGQLVQAEAWEHKPKPTVSAPSPAEVNETSQFMLRFRNMLGVVRLALETDSTRVVTLFAVPLGTLAGIPGVSHETHSLTHHGNRPEMIDELRKIEEAQFRILAEFLSDLASHQEQGSTLLDQTMVLYGTCMGNANGHSNQNWPMLLAGGGFKHGQHLVFDRTNNYPLANLFVSMLQRMGIEIDRFSSSTGTMRGLEFA